MIELNRNQLDAQAMGGTVRVKIVGIGGAGSNVLDRIVLDGIGGVEIVAINTDVQSLTSSVATQKVQLGRSATRGLGAGGDPEVGLAAAEEAVDEIREALEGAELIFICAGLGGGTGSGAAPLVASLAKEHGALTIAVATMPFSFEGKRRASQAEDALASLQESADAVVCFENDRMGEAVSPHAGVHQAFVAADQTISQSVRAVHEIFMRRGIINIGFDDLASALKNHNARCLFGHGEAEGDNRAHEALERALRNPLMDKGRILSDAHNLLVNVAGGPGMTLNEVQILMEELGRHLGDDTHILFGTAVDPRLGGRMCVTLISSVALGASAAGKPAPARITYTAPAPARVRETKPAPAPVEAPAAKPKRAAKPEPAPVEPLLRDDSNEEEEETEVPRPRPIVVKMNPPVIEQPPAPSPAAAPEPITAKAAKAPAKATQERQETLSFEPLNRGRFEKSEPTIVNGQDLDVPTFMRKNIKLK
ncbi:MAG TPA: cell division protein FtsZ [Chthoniobacteraceae bacterium]|nr:cell division protein FtsZ [Chthoniobacteraceae bacterium]